MEENIQHIRLVNGEELLADILDQYNDKILVSCPLLVTEKTNPTGKVTTVLIKYLPFSSNNICEISMDHVITITEIHEEMVRYYHHSLRMANIYQNNMIKEVETVNILMESSMMDSHATVDDLSNNTKLVH